MTWDFWTFFWIVVVPVGLLGWSGIWILRRYNRDLKARAAFYRELEQAEQPDK